MPGKHLTVVARLKAKPEKADLLRNELQALIEPTVLERGCISYQLHESTEHQGCFMFYETWASKKDLDDHLAKPHLQAFFSKADDLLAEPPELSLWHLME